MAAEVKQEINLIDLINRFHNEDTCREYLELLRWPDGVNCPRCGSDSISEISSRDQFDCNKCRYRFSATSGTIFHRSKMPLSKWFVVTYLMVESKKGMSANQIKRTIGVAYKTAWFMSHRIRAAMSEASEEMPIFTNSVDVDETFIGGRARGMGQGYTGKKARVLGIYDRTGKVQLRRVDSGDAKTIQRIINEHVSLGAIAIYSDGALNFQGLGGSNRRHETVNHAAYEWVRGDVHTNSIENVWSLLKRAIAGAYHFVSEKHLDAYLNELEWRFNNRKNPMLFRDTMRQLIESEKLEYKKLTA